MIEKSMMSRISQEVKRLKANKMALPGHGQGNASDDEILEVGTVLLRDFIYERVRRHGDSNTVVARQQLGGGELSDPNHRNLALRLQQIGYQLDGNEELQRVINDPSLNLTKDAFKRVAVEIFSDGRFNWGRVVALFYFSCRLTIKALTIQAHDSIEIIVRWTIDYLRENAINWMREQGGWEGIHSHYGTPTRQMVGVLVAGVLMTVFVIYKK